MQGAGGDVGEEAAVFLQNRRRVRLRRKRLSESNADASFLLMLMDAQVNCAME